MNRISNLPPGILESILCFLPIEEAARTSILSKDWRYRWIKIPKLVFDDFDFHIPTNTAESSDGSESSDGAEFSDGAESSDKEQMFSQPSKKKKFTELTIRQVLLMHEGPLHEFTISVPPNTFCLACHECPEFDNIITHLSRKNTVKKLKFDFNFGMYRLPLSLFSFHSLTDLYLESRDFDYQPTFNGFGSLTSLSFMFTQTSIKSLLHLLSTCPLLKTLTLEINFTYISYTTDTVKDTYTIINLFECLPVIESLSTQFSIFELFEPFVHGRVLRELPTTLRLKFLYIRDVCFTQKHNDGLSILVLLMKSSPNLEKIEIDNTDLSEDDSSMEDKLFTQDDIHSFKLEDYSDIWLEHMRELHIGGLINWGNMLNFVKLILAKSPVLKKVWMSINYRLDDADEELQMYQMLLSFPRASPVVDVIV